MSRWEYLEVYVLSDHGVWSDSSGRTGRLQVIGPRGFPIQWSSCGPLCSELGAEGWELAGATVPGSAGYRMVFKRGAAEEARDDGALGAFRRLA